jgi:hypothetical protein
MVGSPDVMISRLHSKKEVTCLLGLLFFKKADVLSYHVSLIPDHRNRALISEPDNGQADASAPPGCLRADENQHRLQRVEFGIMGLLNDVYSNVKKET